MEKKKKKATGGLWPELFRLADITGPTMPVEAFML